MPGKLAQKVTKLWNHSALAKYAVGTFSFMSIADHYLVPSRNMLTYYDAPIEEHPFAFEKNVEYLILVSDDGNPYTSGDENIKKLARETGLDGEHFHVELYIDGLFYSARYGEVAQARTLDQIQTLFPGSEYIIKEIDIPNEDLSISWFNKHKRGTVYDVQENNCSLTVTGMLEAGAYTKKIIPISVSDFKKKNPFVMQKLQQENFAFKVNELIFPDQFDVYGNFVYKGKLADK